MAGIIRRLFFFIPFLLLVLMTVLGFFQHPCADDFTCYFFSTEYGIGGGIKHMFAHGTGRYTSIPMLMVLTAYRSVLDNIWTVLLPLMAITYCVTYMFLSYFISALFNTRLSVPQKHWLTAAGVLLLAGTVPELSSFMFWMGTAVVYLLSYLVFMVYLVLLHKWYAANTKKATTIVLLLATIVLLCGFNEVAMYYSLAVYGCIFLYRWWFLKKITGTDVLILLFHLLVVVAVFMVPGNYERSAGYSARQSVVFSLASGVYQTLQVFGAIFSSIFFWVAWMGLLWLSGFMTTSVREKVLAKRTTFAFEMLLLFAFVFILAFGLRHTTGHVMPARARNVVVGISMLGLFFITLLNAHRLTGLQTYRDIIDKKKGPLYVFGILLLSFNPFTKDLFQSLINAPVHHTVLHQRIETINSAKRARLSSVVFESYQHDFSEMLERKLGKKGAAFVGEEFPAPPRFLYFADDAVTSFALYYAEYYGIDTVGSRNEMWPRIGLTWDFQKYPVR